MCLVVQLTMVDRTTHHPATPHVIRSMLRKAVADGLMCDSDGELWCAALPTFPSQMEMKCMSMSMWMGRLVSRRWEFLGCATMQCAV